ncbi:universal stress protein [Halobaculum sp. WSA2]|uniref:Universal stress protein n=1 Tax=Halobaculum saliterrae TaxID=2073113 RepID=A0A6B0SWF7_9EURY|nr:universal stress protein [Halobaculum saliterrae]MXR40582.1 universal stress protein [Halobaculum saliterrae]
MYDHILLPFDGSDGATAVLHHVAEIAAAHDATVQVLFVADTTRDSMTVIGGEPVDALVEHGEAVVADAERTLATSGVDCETDVVQGNPAAEIPAYAERYGHDLIAMPTNGRRGISRYLLGSVTEKVVRLSSVPVLTARMRPDERLAFPYEDVLVPTDGSPGVTPAVEHALTLASALGATVHVLSVVDTSSPELETLAATSAEAGEGAATDAIDDVVSRAEAHGVAEVVRHLEHGHPATEILECVDESDADAVVMGTVGRRGTERVLLGSVAERTVRSAPVPVITVRDAE